MHFGMLKKLIPLTVVDLVKSVHVYFIN